MAFTSGKSNKLYHNLSYGMCVYKNIILHLNTISCYPNFMEMQGITQFYKQVKSVWFSML